MVTKLGSAVPWGNSEWLQGDCEGFKRDHKSLPSLAIYGATYRGSLFYKPRKNDKRLFAISRKIPIRAQRFALYKIEIYFLITITVVISSLMEYFSIRCLNNL